MKTCIRFVFMVLISLSVLVPCFSQESSKTALRYGMTMDVSIATAKALFPDSTQVYQSKLGHFYAGSYLFAFNDSNFSILKLLNSRGRNPVKITDYSSDNIEAVSVGLPPKSISDQSNNRCEIFLVDGMAFAYSVYLPLERSSVILSRFREMYGLPMDKMVIDVRDTELTSWIPDDDVHVITCITEPSANVFIIYYVLLDFFSYPYKYLVDK